MTLPDWVGKTEIHVIDTGINFGDLELRIFYIPYRGDICKDDFLKLLTHVMKKGPANAIDIFTLCAYGAIKSEADFTNVTYLIHYNHMVSYYGALRGVFIVPFYATQLRSYFKKIMEIRELDEIENLEYKVATLEDIMPYLQKVVSVYYATYIKELQLDQEIFENLFREFMRLLEPEEEMKKPDELD